MKTAAGVTYEYDGDGRRVSKSNGKLYWYGSGGEILAETDASGNTTAEYIFFGGKRVAIIAAGLLPVQNASFETTNPLTSSCGTGCAYNSGPIPSWTLSGTGGSFQPNSAIFNLPLPDGSIVGWTNGGTISQTLTGTSLQPNSTYTLKVAVGHRLDGLVTNYTVALQAASAVLNSVSGSTGSITAGNFSDIVVTYTTGSTVPSGDLTIALSAAGNQVDYDNVRLTGPSVSYYVEDFLGSSRVMVTSTGAVCYDADFTPFGGESTITNTCPQNNYKFEGKERDAETGNDDFGARYYSNRIGRWLSADWSSVPAPVPYANLTNPQTLNLYSMVADDPESFADLDGHSASQLYLPSGAGASSECGHDGEFCDDGSSAAEQQASSQRAEADDAAEAEAAQASQTPAQSTTTNATAQQPAQPPAQNNNDKPQVAAIGTLDKLHPAMTPQGDIQQQDVYYRAALVTGNEKDGFQIVEKMPGADIMMTEKQTGGTDRLSVCTKPCSVSGQPDEQHVSTVGGTATVQQTFTVNKKPALAIIVKPDGAIVAVGKKIEVKITDKGSTFKAVPGS